MIITVTVIAVTSKWVDELKVYLANLDFNGVLIILKSNLNVLRSNSCGNNSLNHVYPNKKAASKNNIVLL